ncbi:MAG: hypothetical protein ACFFC7_34760 [Candidatus Hermodarchaeota archaeon]
MFAAANEYEVIPAVNVTYLLPYEILRTSELQVAEINKFGLDPIYNELLEETVEC